MCTNEMGAWWRRRKHLFDSKQQRNSKDNTSSSIVFQLKQLGQEKEKSRLTKVAKVWSFYGWPNYILFYYGRGEKWFGQKKQGHLGKKWPKVDERVAPGPFHERMDESHQRKFGITVRYDNLSDEIPMWNLAGVYQRQQPQPAYCVNDQIYVDIFSLIDTNDLHYP